MTDEGGEPAPPSYEEAVRGPFPPMPGPDGTQSVMPPNIAGNPHTISSAPTASQESGDMAGTAGAYGGRAADSSPPGAGVIPTYGAGMGGAPYAGVGAYRGQMEPAKAPLPGDSVHTGTPTISDSPHSSDDEETMLLKRELRRVREEKMKQKKLLLQQEINNQRNRAGYSSVPSSSHTAEQPHPYMGQPHPYMAGQPHPPMNIHHLPQYGAATGGASGSTAAADTNVSVASTNRPGERFTRMQIKGRKFRYADTSSSGLAVYVAGKPLTGDLSWFEIEIRECGPKNSIVIGLVPKEYPLDVQPGLLPYSVGYHNNDGVYASSSRGIQITKKCYPGARMGCGIDLQNCSPPRPNDTVKVFLTRNGRKTGEVRVMFPEGGLYPAICMSSYGDEVKIRQGNMDEGYPVNIRDDANTPTDGVDEDAESNTKSNFAVMICCLALVGVIGLLVSIAAIV